MNPVSQHEGLKTRSSDEYILHHFKTLMHFVQLRMQMLPEMLLNPFPLIKMRFANCFLELFTPWENDFKHCNFVRLRFF